MQDALENKANNLLINPEVYSFKKSAVPSGVDMADESGNGESCIKRRYAGEDDGM